MSITPRRPASNPDRADLLPEGQHRLCGPNDPVEKPATPIKLDWEVEIAAIIGTRAKYVSEADALNHVAGYCVCNDVSERNFQLERLGQWTKGKSHDTFGPLGPWLVTRDEIPDVQKLSMWLDVNGERRQTGSTSTMIFTDRQVHRLRLAVPDAAAGRHRHHRHPARRRRRHEADAEIPQCRRRGHARHRGARRAAAENRRGVSVLVILRCEPDDALRVVERASKDDWLGVRDHPSRRRARCAAPQDDGSVYLSLF